MTGPSITRRPSSPRRRLGAALAGVVALAAPLATTAATTAGYTDSTFAGAAFVTTSGLESPPVAADQSAASSLFLSSAGDLYVSGYRGTGDGNGATSVPPTADPTRVAFPDGVRIVDAAGSTNDFHAPFADTTSFLALDADGAVWTWGRPYGGQRLIGRGALTVAESARAGRVTRTAHGGSLPPIVSVARTENQFLALDREGVLWAWGYGGENLPNPRGAVDAPLPFPVRDVVGTPSGASCVGAGGARGMRWRSVWGGTNSAGAVGRDGLVYTWGFDTTDGLGGATVSARCPALNEGANRALFQRYPALYATADGRGYDESELPTEADRHQRYLEIVAHLRGGTLVECDGSKETGSVDPSACPVRQLGFSAGAARMLTRDGELLTWLTKRGYGEPFLGRDVGPDSPAERPAPVAGDLRVDATVAGVSSVLALTRDGRAFGWGANNACQAIGAPTLDGERVAGGCAEIGPAASPRTQVPLPMAVAGIPDGARLVGIATTQCAAWASADDGALYAWGGGTVAGASFSRCTVPSAGLRGYKIYRYDEVSPGSPFGTPVTEAATATIRVRG